RATPVPWSPTRVSAANKIHGARGWRQTTTVRSAFTKVTSLRLTTAGVPLARSAAETVWTSAEFVSPGTSARSRLNQQAAGPGFSRSPSTVRVSTPVKNGLQRLATSGIGRPASGPRRGGVRSTGAAFSAGSTLKNTAVPRATGLPPWTSEASTVRALRPSRSTGDARHEALARDGAPQIEREPGRHHARRCALLERTR